MGIVRILMGTATGTEWLHPFTGVSTFNRVFVYFRRMGKSMIVWNQIIGIASTCRIFYEKKHKLLHDSFLTSVDNWWKLNQASKTGADTGKTFLDINNKKQ